MKSELDNFLGFVGGCSPAPTGDGVLRGSCQHGIATHNFIAPRLAIGRHCNQQLHPSFQMHTVR
jgi:hypothetical protein